MYTYIKYHGLRFLCVNAQYYKINASGASNVQYVEEKWQIKFWKLTQVIVDSFFLFQFTIL